MSSIFPGAHPAPAVKKSLSPVASPIPALTEAFSHTVKILFDPFDLQRWIEFSAVCLFLGGGASWAAIHWSLGALPGDTGVEHALGQLRRYLAQQIWLSLALGLFGVALGVALIYVRAICRFALVDSILRGQVRLQYAWVELRPVARTYFRWLLGALLLGGLMLAGSVLFAFPLLRPAGARPIVVSALVVALVLVEVLIAVLMGLAITLTDDLVVPIIYAERQTLPAAWGKLVATMKSDVGAFVLYFLLRFVVSVGVGIAVLFFLFPALVALFSGATIIAVLALLALQLLGINWVWTPLTTLVAAVAALLLAGLLLLVMGIAGMPGQVFLQTFGLRFIAPLVPALRAVWDGQVPKSRRP